MIRYCGVDPSVSGTGLVIMSKDGEVLQAKSIKAGKEEDPLRFMKLTEELVKHLDPATDKILIEGFSYGSKGRGISVTYGTGWCMRIYFEQLGFQWQEVPPSSLKKYASDHGNASKKLVGKAVKRKWGFESSSDDIVDAYVLARMAWSMYNHDALLDYEKLALSKVKKV